MHTLFILLLSCMVYSGLFSEDTVDTMPSNRAILEKIISKKQTSLASYETLLKQTIARNEKIDNWRKGIQLATFVGLVGVTALSSIGQRDTVGSIVSVGGISAVLCGFEYLLAEALKGELFIPVNNGLYRIRCGSNDALLAHLNNKITERKENLSHLNTLAESILEK